MSLYLMHPYRAELFTFRYEGQQADDPGIPRSSAPRQLAHSLSPRLGILSNIPFAIPFETRVLIIRTEAEWRYLLGGPASCRMDTIDLQK
jgi:hypothetical protein